MKMTQLDAMMTKDNFPRGRSDAFLFWFKISPCRPVLLFSINSFRLFSKSSLPQGGVVENATLVDRLRLSDPSPIRVCRHRFHGGALLISCSGTICFRKVPLTMINV